MRAIRKCGTAAQYRRGRCRCAACRAAVAAYQRRWRIEKAETHQTAVLKRLYGITSAQYDQMLEKQKGVCAICEGAFKVKQRLDVDHCHTGQMVRGLLCRSCNIHLGWFERFYRRTKQYLDLD